MSPIEPRNTHWRTPPPQKLPDDAKNQADNELRKRTPKRAFAGFSDWEHFEPIGDHVEATNRSGTTPTYAEHREQDAYHLGYPVDLSYVATGHHVAEVPHQPRRNEHLPEQESPVSSAAVASPMALPATPTPLSMSRACRNPTEERDSASHRSGDSPSVNVIVPQRAGTIDGVIQAWNKPLDGQNSWRAEDPTPSRASSRQSSVSAFSTTRSQDDPAETTKPSPKRRQNSKPRLSIRSVSHDPYADLEPEYRASLVRYVTMLRKESAASSEIGKFNIFKAFMDKELRLRSILYSQDEGATETTKVATSDTVQPISISNPDQGREEQPLRVTPTPVPEENAVANDAVGRTFISRRHDRSESPNLAVSASPASNAESYVVIEQIKGDIEYSPGGRPKVSKLQAVPKGSQHASPKRRATASVPVITSSKGDVSPSDNAPIVLEDYSTGGPDSPGRNAPIVLDMQDQVIRPSSAPLTSKVPPATPLKFEPPRPVYTPFRYTEASREDLDNLTIQQPAYQAYAAMRQSADSGRILAQASNATGSPTLESQDRFLGLIRSQSRARPNNRPETPSHLLVQDPRTEASLAIRSRVPKTLPDGSQHPKLAAIRQEMEKIQDEFGFIRETVLHWDHHNRQIRERQDRERRCRQEESEKHIDGLYDDKEIGYADIGTMEANFKLAETKRKYEEDQQELESFTAEVFEPVTRRLQTEISKLNAQYILAVELLDLKSDSASQWMNAGIDREQASQVMNVVILLFNKLQIRHQKLAEAHFEREKRRKKLELTVLYANGDVVAIKKLEQEFLTAERLQVLHETEERDLRANKLMDDFDRATARALGDNQAYIDDLSAKLRAMDAALASDGRDFLQTTFEPGGLREILSQTKAALNFVAGDSHAMLGASNTADMILNEADYAVSLAKAQMANASRAVHVKLKEEKQKEDAKIREDLETRRESIGKGPAEASSVIDGIVARLGPDAEHQERLQRALEVAKMRNASKDA